MLTAEIFFAEQRIGKEVLYTAGASVTYGQLADAMDLVLGRKVERVLWTVPILKEQLASDSDSALCKYRVVLAEGREVAWPMREIYNAQKAIAVVGIEHWIRETFSSLRTRPGLKRQKHK